MLNLRYVNRFAPLACFQWRTNGASGVCAVIAVALKEKSMAQLGCANCFFQRPGNVARCRRKSNVSAGSTTERIQESPMPSRARHGSNTARAVDA